MKAIVCERYGDVADLVYRDLPDPHAGPGEVVIAVEVTGINFPDGLMVRGEYQVKPDLPFVPGSEVCGHVIEVGTGVETAWVGQRVAAYTGVGAYAHRVVAPAAMITPVPAAISGSQAAVLPVAYGTAAHALQHRARLTAGETVLVLGAAGGVGSAAVELAKIAGARVVAVVSRSEKAEFVVGLGADDVVVRSRRDEHEGQLPESLKADVVLDTVGGSLATQALRRLAWGGRYLVVGFASGEIPSMRLNRVLLSSSSVVGVMWGPWARRHPEQNASLMRDLVRWLGEGRVAPHIHQSYDLQDAASALLAVTSGSVLGKIVLRSARVTKAGV